MSSRADRHLRSLLADVATAPGATSSTEGDLFICRTGIAWPAFNGGIGGETSQIQEAARELDPEQGPSFFWWFVNEPDPEAVATLERAGLAHFDGPEPWMEAPIESLPPAVMPEGGELLEAVDEASYRIWSSTLVAAFSYPAVAGERWFEIAQLFGFGCLPWRQWTVLHEGEPAGVTLSYNGAGTAGLFTMAVVPEKRRLGFGSFLTLMPLHEAAVLGESVAGFWATPEGLPLYESLGFRSDGSISRWLGGKSPF